MDRWARVALLIAGVLCPPLAEAFAGSLSSAEITLGRTAFKAARSSDWTRAQSQIGAIRDPLAAKLMQWHRATREDSRMSFEEISVFMGENPDWPSQHLMRQQAEKAMTPAIPSRRMVAWFERFEPLTGEGKIMFSRALLAVGDRQKAHDAARSAWISSKFTPDQEESFLREFGSMLMPSDHAKRLDLLLWAARSAEAARMLPKVDPGLQDLARARMQLRSLAADVDRAVARVPPKLQNDPGLIYERIRWRRMKDRDSEAIELLLRHPLDAAQPSLWAVERQILARRALASGRFREAYRVASAHAVEAGAEFAEAEWLSGWIALRYLNDPKMAKRHFETMYKKVSYPISLARGAYWRGRAAEALGESADARQWYRTAAEHPATYYGQLAAARVGPDQPLPLPPDPRPSADERRVFEASELVAAVRMLAVFQQHELVAPFLANLETMRESASWRALAAALATEIGRPDLAVSIARRVNQSGAILVGQGYPSVPIPAIQRRGGQGKAAGPIEQPLVLAIIRQESGYRTDAISSAGARGLMQLMPRTAQQVATELNLPYSVSRLITDSDYNLTLGQTYFHSVLDRFEGSYVLALAGYNAGPYRVQQWRAQMGDPGRDLEAIIDWIERIPFNETRNYIQRILEHLQVYRGKINGGIEPKLLEMDLRR